MDVRESRAAIPQSAEQIASKPSRGRASCDYLLKRLRVHQWYTHTHYAPNMTTLPSIGGSGQRVRNSAGTRDDWRNHYRDGSSGLRTLLQAIGASPLHTWRADNVLGRNSLGHVAAKVLALAIAMKSSFLSQ